MHYLPSILQKKGKRENVIAFRVINSYCIVKRYCPFFFRYFTLINCGVSHILTSCLCKDSLFSRLNK